MCSSDLDGSHTGTVSALLSSQHPDWGRERYPNMVQSISIEDVPHLLVTLKGSAGTGTTPTNEGQIVLWNVSDRTAPQRVWGFPEDGHLAAVHSGRVVDTPGGSLMIYAHSLGASSIDSDVREGTIGFAAFNGTEPPTYLADGRLPDPGFGFTREVEWVDDINRLMVTDSGCENAQDDCSRQGRVVMTELPDMTPSERTGSARPDGADQDYIELNWIRSAVDAALELPFDADRINLDDAGPALNSGIGNCETP